MSKAALTVPIRVRVTVAERERYQKAMERLQVVEFSVFVRWALENGAMQVLGPTEPAAKVPAPRRAPRAPAPRPPPAPVAAPTMFADPPRLPPAASAGPTLLGIPLYAESAQDAASEPRAALVDDEGWI